MKEKSSPFYKKVFEEEKGSAVMGRRSMKVCRE